MSKEWIKSYKRHNNKQLILNKLLTKNQKTQNKKYKAHQDLFLKNQLIYINNLKISHNLENKEESEQNKNFINNYQISKTLFQDNKIAEQVPREKYMLWYNKYKQSFLIKLINQVQKEKEIMRLFQNQLSQRAKKYNKNNNLDHNFFQIIYFLSQYLLFSKYFHMNIFTNQKANIQNQLRDSILKKKQRNVRQKKKIGKVNFEDNKVQQENQQKEKIDPTPKQKQQNYWGNVIPYKFNEQNQVPSIVISKSIIKICIFNVITIILICLIIPIVISQNLYDENQIRASIRLLINQEQKSLAQLMGANLSKSINQIKHNINKVPIYIYSIIWTTFTIILLIIILLSNPGYRKINLNKIKQNQNKLISQIQKQMNNQKCQKCNNIIDNNVFHCSDCDLCCEGFSHHCFWLDKCIGIKNIIYFKAYILSFPIGIIFLVSVIILQI